MIKTEIVVNAADWKIFLCMNCLTDGDFDAVIKIYQRCFSELSFTDKQWLEMAFRAREDVVYRVNSSETDSLHG
jgi:hypothetical protein